MKRLQRRFWLEVVRDNPDLRQWVVHNKTVPVGILELLHLDPSERVRMTVASKSKLPIKLQQALSRNAGNSSRAIYRVSNVHPPPSRHPKRLASQ